MMRNFKTKIFSSVPKIFRHVRGHFISFLFATAFGAVLTSVTFYVTSPPTTAAEVRQRISDLALESIRPDVDERIEKIRIDYFSSESLDLSAASSVFVSGTAGATNGDVFRFLGIFQPSPPSLMDRLVGRQGFIKPTYIAVIPAADDESAMTSDVVIKDIDLDGNKEILITLKSNRADNVPIGLVILKKGSNDVWNAFGIPGLNSVMKNLLAACSVSPVPTEGCSKIWFARSKLRDSVALRSREEYAGLSVSEESMELIHNGKSTEFSMLQNGGRFEFFAHPELGHQQLGIVVPIDDGEAVQEDHHVLITFLRIEERQMSADPSWNWGRPMLSLDTENVDDIDLGKFEDAGVAAHTVGGMFFSPIGYHR
jgi:hypothetical protein